MTNPGSSNPVDKPVAVSELADRLATVKMLSDVPRAELEWLAVNGTNRVFPAGYVVAPKDKPAHQMLIVFSGRIVVRFEHGTGRRHAMETRGGAITGVLPFSRLTHPMNDVVAEEETESLVIAREQFPAMIRECPTVLERLVHVMLDRARRFSATDWQDEKMVSLGRLAAGVAHEINNPASAAIRGTSLLANSMQSLRDAEYALGRLDGDGRLRTEVNRLVGRSSQGGAGAASVIERSDDEQRLARLLDPLVPEIDLPTVCLDGGLRSVDVEPLVSMASGEAREAALRLLACALNAQQLSIDVQRSLTRVTDLVAAIKRFTFMDRSPVFEPTDIAQGLRDTVTVMMAKAAGKDARLTLNVSPALPMVPAMVAELNQVWVNLLDNAIDAVGTAGEVTIEATTEGDQVVVRFVDNGPGIPENIQSRIFDPFFTTKGVGQGIGLGLEVVRRIVRGHDGVLEMETSPGRTVFSVRLPRTRSDDASLRSSEQ